MMMLLDVFVSMRHITIGPKKKQYCEKLSWENKTMERHDKTELGSRRRNNGYVQWPNV